jgi:hypothetical protein
MTSIVHRSFNGVEMGILEDGTPFLTGRGLAVLCGIASSTLAEWSIRQLEESKNTREVAMRRLLEDHNHEGDLFVKVRIGKYDVNAYPDTVCMALLEYYAFEVKPENSQARENYRKLARGGLRTFIFHALGYSPEYRVPEAFRSFHDRLCLNVLPRGVYSCFTETAHIVLAAIRAGLVVDDETIPDISVGQAWSRYWEENNLSVQFGVRTRHPHTYPPEYRQAQTVPEAYTYPVESLGVFRKWLDEVYLPEKYPNYIRRKVKMGSLPPSQAERLLGSVMPKQIGSNMDFVLALT